MKEFLKEFFIAFVCSAFMLATFFVAEELINFVWGTTDYMASITRSL